MRILKRIALALGAIIVLAIVVTYAGSEWIIRSSHAVPLEQIAIPRDSASIAEGGRLAKLFGCRGCHGPSAQGAVWNDPPWFVASIAPPGIARKIADYSDAELLRLIRHGVKKNGTSIFVMPTEAHRFIADDDAAKLIAWLRTLQPTDKDVTQPMHYGPVGRFAILAGKFGPSVQVGKVAEAHRPADVGRYFYDSVCSECHAIDKPRMAPDGSAMAPALGQMAAAYDPAAFRTLLRTGRGMSGRDLGLMSQVAKENFYALSDQEIATLQAYLKSEGEKGAK